MSYLHSEHYALNFAVALMQRLDEPRGFGRNGSSFPFFVSGRWALRSHQLQSEVSVPLEFGISCKWMSSPPLVRSSAAFIRREIDWHCSGSGLLCIGLPEEWKDEFEFMLQQRMLAPEELLDVAATWTLASTDSLISRHLLGARYGLKKWPREWAQWAHFEEGRRAYRRMKENSDAKMP